MIILSKETKVKSPKGILILVTMMKMENEMITALFSRIILLIYYVYKPGYLTLQTLLENRNIVLSRDTLLERVWGFDYLGETNVVDVYVRYLRAKLDDVYGIRLIRTVRGVGDAIKDEADE